MTHTHRTRRTVSAADHATLLEIADVLDEVAACRAELYTDAAVDEGALRVALFTLLDKPTQETWEKVREVEVVPAYLPGLTTPSPLGLTLADIVYACGLPDVVCPSRAALLRALRRVVDEHGAPMQG
ncbi:hypothetical protein [Xylanimonas protaetiae]|uniref:Uncharacterized protein n=1 Tax=Xylanimonas protaetiae TaxID=2509457 RepID=A0A4P6FFJ0_9MICO|nr:hypothetical protein [Xylanimonas protaetiae]QAY69358.1 hypothetical protein ET471_04295 [Xylanimonas protaetiae]